MKFGRVVAAAAAAVAVAVVAVCGRTTTSAVTRWPARVL